MGNVRSQIFTITQVQDYDVACLPLPLGDGSDPEPNQSLWMSEGNWFDKLHHLTMPASSVTLPNFLAFPEGHFCPFFFSTPALLKASGPNGRLGSHWMHCFQFVLVSNLYARRTVVHIHWSIFFRPFPWSQLGARKAVGAWRTCGIPCSLS